MPADLFRVSQPQSTDLMALQRLVDELNLVHSRIADQLTQLSGRDSGKAILAGDLDLGGKRITNVGRTSTGRDVPSRDELRERALYLGPDGKHHATRPIVAAEGLRVDPRKRKGADDTLSKSEIEALIARGGGGNNIVIERLDPSGFDGMETVFADLLSAEPNIATNDTLLYHAGVGVIMRVTTVPVVGEYALSGSTNQTVTFGLAPGTGAQVYAIYTRA